MNNKIKEKYIDEYLKDAVKKVSVAKPHDDFVYKVMNKIEALDAPARITSNQLISKTGWFSCCDCNSIFFQYFHIRFFING